MPGQKTKKKGPTVQGHVYVSLDDQFSLEYELRTFEFDETWLPIHAEIVTKDGRTVSLIIAKDEGNRDIFALYISDPDDALGTPRFSVCTLDGETLLSVTHVDDAKYDLTWEHPRVAPSAIINGYLTWQHI